MPCCCRHGVLCQLAASWLGWAGLPGGVQAQQAAVGQVHHREGLVHLPVVDVTAGQACPESRWVGGEVSGWNWDAGWVRVAG